MAAGRQCGVADAVEVSRSLQNMGSVAGEHGREVRFRRLSAILSPLLLFA